MNKREENEQYHAMECLFTMSEGTGLEKSYPKSIFKPTELSDMLARLYNLVSSDGMKGRAARAASFSILSFGSSQLIRLLSNLILTRILFPEVFGLMALVQVVIIGLESFSDTGIHPSIIQSQRGDTQRFLDTAWTLQIARGVILWILACIIASPVATFYEQSELTIMIQVLGVTTIITGFRSTNYSLASRNITIGRLTIVELAGSVIGTTILIILAFWLESVWALVIGAVIGSLLHTILSHVILEGKRNRFVWDTDIAWEIFHFGKYIAISTIAGYLVFHGDRLILGKFISLEELALFTIAFLFGSLPQTLNQLLNSRVLLPLFKQRPPVESRQNFIKIHKLRSIFIGGLLFVSVVLVGFGEPLVELLYTEIYHAAGPLLVLLCLANLPNMITEGYRGVFLANGNSYHFTVLMFLTAGIKVSLLLLFVPNYGSVGAVAAIALAEIAVYPFLVYFMKPYKTWNPTMDAGFAFSMCLIAAIAIWLSPGALPLIQG
jgi:O-antigen/teichoic acid export membrane protein